MKSVNRIFSLFCMLLVLLSTCSYGNAQLAMDGNTGSTLKNIDSKVFVFEKQSASDPLTVDELRFLRSEVVSYYKRSNHLEELLVPAVVPELQDGDSIYAYGFCIDAGGRMFHYIGVGHSERDVSTIHDDADRWYDQFITNSSSSASDDFILIGYMTYSSEPYGVISSPTMIRYLGKHPSLPNVELYNISEDFTQTPGHMKWRNNYHNVYSEVYQNWGCDQNRNNFTSREEYGDYPDNTIHGEATQTVTVGTSGISYSYTYMQPDISIYPQGWGGYDGCAKWKADYNNEYVWWNRVSFNPTSEWGVEYDHSIHNLYMVEVKSIGMFKEGWIPFVGDAYLMSRYWWVFNTE